MKAALLYGEHEQLRVENVETPRPDAGDVLIQVDACGICGTDVHLAEKQIPTGISPVIPGHEITGTVVGIGADVKNVQLGQRVLVFPQIFCGDCSACRRGAEELCARPRIFGIDVDGGFAEYISVPQRVVMPVPANVTGREAALFAESVGVAFHALFARGRVRSGEYVLITGAGGLGSAAVKLLVALGNVRIAVLDTSEAALERARRLGATLTINSQSEDVKTKVRAATEGAGMDASFDFVGRAASASASYHALAKGGRLVLVGVGQEKADFGTLLGMVASGREIIPSFGYSMESAARLRSFVEERELSFGDMVTQTFPLSEINAAIERLKTGSGECVRLLVEPGR